MASLAGLKGADRLREKESQLMAIAMKLNAISGDNTMLLDTLGVIRSLHSRISAAESHYTDSGYDSTAGSVRHGAKEQVNSNAGIPNTGKEREDPSLLNIALRHSLSGKQAVRCNVFFEATQSQLSQRTTGFDD